MSGSGQMDGRPRRLPRRGCADVRSGADARLGREDALNEYIRHVGSALFAVPGGAGPHRYVGQTLLES